MKKNDSVKSNELPLGCKIIASLSIIITFVYIYNGVSPFTSVICCFNDIILIILIYAYFILSILLLNKVKWSNDLLSIIFIISGILIIINFYEDIKFFTAIVSIPFFFCGFYLILKRRIIAEAIKKKPKVKAIKVSIIHKIIGLITMFYSGLSFVFLIIMIIVSRNDSIFTEFKLGFLIIGILIYSISFFLSALFMINGYKIANDILIALYIIFMLLIFAFIYFEQIHLKEDINYDEFSGMLIIIAIIITIIIYLLLKRKNLNLIKNQKLKKSINLYDINNGETAKRFKA